PFKPFSGANACFVLEASELGFGPAQPPQPVAAHVEARVLDWTQRTEDLPEDLLAAHLDQARWRSVAGEVSSIVSPLTKLGGLPAWGGFGPSDMPPVPWRFVLQMNNYHFFRGEMPEEPLYQAPDQPIEIATSEYPGYDWYCWFANFGE